MTSRRTALAVLAAGTASTMLGQENQPGHTHGDLHDTPKAPAKRTAVHFNPADFATVSILCDLIIPRTDTPGAADAGVPYIIDKIVAGNPKLQEQYRQGLAGLTRQPEVVLPPPDSPFFVLLKNMTIDAYYKTEEGLVEELGFKGNTYRATFTGCTHPEHQV